MRKRRRANRTITTNSDQMNERKKYTHTMRKIFIHLRAGNMWNIHRIINSIGTGWTNANIYKVSFRILLCANEEWKSAEVRERIFFSHSHYFAFCLNSQCNNVPITSNLNHQCFPDTNPGIFCLCVCGCFFPLIFALAMQMIKYLFTIFAKYCSSMWKLSL